MKKIMGRILICLFVTVLFWFGAVLADRERLDQELIRLHVVAASDSVQDQNRKLCVRDAVMESLREDLAGLTDAQQAMDYIQEKLPYIQLVARDTLTAMGCKDAVTVSLCREAFDTRVYDTFTLPAGVYNALRIVIGDGQGQNWWCVVFPGFCVGAVSSDFEDVAVSAGFPEDLRNALTGEEAYHLRFGILDALGRLENILHGWL